MEQENNQGVIKIQKIRNEKKNNKKNEYENKYQL